MTNISGSDINETQHVLPLVGTQQGIWLADQFSVHKNQFNVAQYVDIAGDIKPSLLQQAIVLGLAEADTVHSCYRFRGDELMQWIPASAASLQIAPIQMVDLGEHKDPVSTALKKMLEDFTQAIDVTGNKTLYCHQLFQVSNSKNHPRWFWYQRYHHLMVDGFSFTAITKRITDIYKRLVSGETQEQSPFTRFSNVVDEYKTYNQSEKYKKDQDFWRSYTQQLLPSESLASAYHVKKNLALSESSQLEVIRYQCEISAESVRNIVKAVNDNKVTSTEILISIILIYLAKTTGSKNIVVGFPFMRRMGSAALFASGPVVNVLPLQIQILPSFTLIDVANALVLEIRKIRKHQKYEAEQIQRDMGLAGSAGRLYGPTINCKLFDYELQFDGVEAKTHQLATGPIEDIEFSLYLNKNTVVIELAANSNNYYLQDLLRHSTRLQTLVKQLAKAEGASQLLPHLQLLGESEAQLIKTWSQGQLQDVSVYGADILHSFDQQVINHPNQKALVFQQHELSYGELSARANQLSRALLMSLSGSANSPPLTVIAVALERSVESIVAIIAIMRLGAVYLPLDLNYPTERLLMICEDAQPALIVSIEQAMSSLPKHIASICLNTKTTQVKIARYSRAALNEKESGRICNATGVAYLFYTSGSTGKPKGVLVPHSAMINLMAALETRTYAGAKKQLAKSRLNVALTGSLSFDTSWDPILLLMLGHPLVLFGDEIKRDTQLLIEAIDRHKIDVLAIAPSLAMQLLDANLMGEDAIPLDSDSRAVTLSSTRYRPTLMNICGEAVSVKLWEMLQRYPRLHAHNIYGPTEFTVYATSANISKKYSYPIIGTPLANTAAYVLDSFLNPTPMGVSGELYLAGNNMTCGYLNRAEATVSRFVASPFGEGERMYRTGDVVCWNASGQLEFIGRCDNQVKIRGHRIELGEIEAAFCGVDEVKEVCVIVHSSTTSDQLVAYCRVDNVEMENQEKRTTKIKESIGDILPNYMMPAFIIFLEEFPLTVSGKINKQALPKPAPNLQQSEKLPTTALEVLICQAVATVLDVSSVGMGDDFFQLAGDSISAMRLSGYLYKRGYQLKPQDIFLQRTLEKMANSVELIANDSERQLGSGRSSAESINEINRIMGSATIFPSVFPHIEANEQGLLLAVTQSNEDNTSADEAKAALQKKYPYDCDILPALPLQAGLLFHSQLGSQAHNYSFTTRLDLRGNVDVDRLGASLDCLLAQFPQLAAMFDIESCSVPLQIIPRPELAPASTGLLQWPLSKIDLRQLNKTQRQQQLHELEINEAHLAFALRNNADVPIMARASLVHLAESQYVLLLTMHHLITDGWSTPVLIQSLLQAYRGGKGNASYRYDYSSAVSGLCSVDVRPAQLAWQNYLKHCAPTIVFNEASKSDAVHEIRLPIANDVMQRLSAIGKKHGITLNTFMQMVWGILLSSMVGKNDVVYASPVSGRSRDIENLDRQIGLFSNTLPVRVTIDPNNSVLQQMHQLQQQQIAIIEFDSLGLGEIQRIAKCETLCDTLLVVENYPVKKTILGQDYNGLTLVEVENRGYTHFPLTILILPGEKPRILFEYRDSVSQPETLAQRFVYLLAQLSDDPHKRICQLDLQTPEERCFIASVNKTQRLLPSLTLVDLLRQQALTTPQQMALHDDQQALSYQQMRQKIKHVSGRLCAFTHSVNAIMAVALPRSVNLSLALQSVLEVGAAYLPLDTSYPDERLQFMLHDARPVCLITCRELASRCRAFHLEQSNIQLLLIEDLLDDDLLPASLFTIDNQGQSEVKTQIQCEIQNLNQNEGQGPNEKQGQTNTTLSVDSPAYVIYTSGSTGKPKAVVISHAAIVNRLLWMQDQYQLQADDVVLQKTPASFDVSVWELFWPLIQGAALVMAPPESHRDPAQLLQLIQRYRVSTMHFVPSMLAALVHYVSSHFSQTDSDAICASLRRVFCSGEALASDLASEYTRYFRAPLHNLYGPTEAAVDVSYYAVIAEDAVQQRGIPIGKPVWNTQFRILDHQLREVGIGVAGELYLCGNQLALAYLNRPDLTAIRFVADPFAVGSRMYRTGDFARWLPSGDVDYLGRSDDQVKIRGLRIEMGEIEQALLRLNNVKQAVVHAREIQATLSDVTGGDNRQLVAYLVAKNSRVLDATLPDNETIGRNNLSANELHSDFDASQFILQLASYLPAHMVPTTFVWIDRLPLSVNGKLDRKALPEPLTSIKANGRSPSAGVETIIAAAFTKLLGVEKINAEDDFFLLGGHSLLAMRLVAELTAKTQLPVSVGQIMVSSTVEELAEVLSNKELRDDPTSSGFGNVLPIRKGGGLPLICINPGSGFSWQYTGFPKYLTGKYPIIGLQSPRPNGAVAVSENMQQAVDYYLDVLREVQPRGPYHLMGYSFGGTIAIELAARLVALGETVAFVGLLDTYPPEGQEWKRPTEEEALQEVEREKNQFMQAAQSEFSDARSLQQQQKMFRDIIANYDDTVRLLSAAKTTPYHGDVVIFVAEKTLPDGWNVEKSWEPFVKKLHQHRLPFSHDDLLSSQALATLGVLLNNNLKKIVSLND